ncbi:MAG: hypothetical protein FWD47_09990 [Treponema sp.]|nr:hypothetical protein [Treponema sp.]
METKKNDKNNFLVLVPHRDTRQEIKKYSDLLLNTGITEVYPFPLVSPIALLSKPLNHDELKQIAYNIRFNIGTSKIFAKETSTVTIPTGKGDMKLFGIKLELNLPNILTQRHIEPSVRDHKEHGEELRNNKIKNIINPFIIGFFLIPNLPSPRLCVSARENFSFRAAAIANMSWQPIQDGFKYKIGKLCWLPKKINQEIPSPS